MLPVASASGVRLRLADGRELVDGMASWWAAIHGYRHPVLDAAVRDQLGPMAHVMFGGLTHAPAVELAERLVEITPAPCDRVFFTDSGSVAVEVAMKMARPVLVGRAGGRAKHRLLTRARRLPRRHPRRDVGVRPGHGHAPAVPRRCRSSSSRPRPPAGFDDALRGRGHRRAGRPARRPRRRVAAVILEPVVQGAGGMRFYSPALPAPACASCATRTTCC